MFKFKPTKKTYTDPATAVFRPAIALGPKYFKGDICLLDEKILYSKIILNSNILREALLNSKDVIEDMLDIKITDKRKVLKEANKEMEVVEAPVTKEKVPETARELVLDSEELILTAKKNKK